MKIGIAGLGEIGLRMALYYAASGHEVAGVDISEGRLDSIAKGNLPWNRHRRTLLRHLLREGKLQLSRDYSPLGEAEAVLICVTSSLTDEGEPDVTAVDAASRELAGYLRREQLVVLESSVPPGTTRGLVLGNLNRSGLTAGSDYFLAYSPHRIDPGSPRSPATIPRLVAGYTGACLARAMSFYRATGQRVVPVSTPEVAETAKLYENAFRLVNISLANELAHYCRQVGLDPGEVIAAAATKPFGFMPFWPGPGAGGPCIPVTPAYLLAHGRQHGAKWELLSAALRINQAGPSTVVADVLAALTRTGKRVERSLVYVLGVTYKKGTGDLRRSPILRVMQELLGLGARLEYHDPFIPTLVVAGRPLTARRPEAEFLSHVDCLLIGTDHDCYPLNAIASAVRASGGAVIDPRATLAGATAHHEAEPRLCTNPR